jgi:DNA-binding CsgD family transcriptional regulator
MASVAIPTSLLDLLGDEKSSPERIGAEIAAIAKSRRYTILRLTKLNGLSASLVESSVDPCVTGYIADLLAKEGSVLSRKLASSVVPFTWTPANEHFFDREAYTGSAAWSDFAGSDCTVFFRRNTPTETIVFMAHGCPEAFSSDNEALMTSQGWLQVVFDVVVMEPRSRVDPHIRVTVRERECLRWCAEGKTSEEIGIILSLSTHTVNHYLISATKKLNAVNRVHAITTAIRLGLLDINSPL